MHISSVGLELARVALLFLGVVLGVIAQSFVDVVCFSLHWRPGVAVKLVTSTAHCKFLLSRVAW